VRAAVEAASGALVLTARCENLLHGVTDLDATIERLQAYAEAGADVLYAPGLRDAGQVRAVCSAVSKPVNVLAHQGLTMAEIAGAGGQRASVGGALAWAAVHACVDAAVAMRDDGDFSGLRGSGSFREWL
jgi:2-methylisocitrate lyase-like PEP mutase family enzyme